MNTLAAPPTIALLSDFGQKDWYVAAMKGEILKRAPLARLLDLTHAVPPCDIASGAFLLGCVLDSLPRGTILCCVVDPGVGTARRALCGRIGAWGFAGPDNGLATPPLAAAAGDFDLHEITNADFMSEAAARRDCHTFHGRDLFAPAAARLALGAEPAAAGPAVADPLLLPPNEPEETPAGVTARVVWIDRFGNLVTNLTRARWAERLASAPFTLRAGGLRVAGAGAGSGAGAVSRAFGEARPLEPLAYWGSAGMLEIAVNQGSAAAMAGLSIGDPVRLDWIV